MHAQTCVRRLFCSKSARIELAKMRFFMVLMILGSSLFCDALQHTYFISPHSIVNKTCTVNGSETLSPCYSLHQLSTEENVLSDKSQVTLILLSGTHIGHAFSASNVSVLKVFPRNEEEKIVIRCLSQEGFSFRGVSSLRIAFLTFSGCRLKYSVDSSLPANLDGSNVVAFMVIKNCVFAYSKEESAVSIGNDVIESDYLNVLIDNCTFSSNTGALNINPDLEFIVRNNIDILITNTIFLNNKQYDIATLEIFYANLTLDNCTFGNNIATEGGAISSSYSSLIINNTVFRNNYAYKRGGAISSYSSDVAISNCSFLENTAEVGGGAISDPSSFDLVINNTIFKENNANSGGAIYAEFLRILNCPFTKNSAGFGGALYFFEEKENSNNEVVSLINVSFTLNKALWGGAIYCERCSSRPGIKIDGGYSRSNSARSGGFVYLSACRLTITRHNFYIIGNSADKGGAIYASKESTLDFLITTVLLANNVAKESGGAIFLTNSQITTIIGSRVEFIHNVVTSEGGKGGAIFAQDSSNCEARSTPNGQCFMKVSYVSRKPFLLINNSAHYGSVLYGGLLDRCIQRDSYNPKHLRGIDFFKQISEYEHTPLAITSDPVKLCLCNSNTSQPDCEVRELRMVKMRGQIVNLKLTPVDQDRYSWESVVKANYEESSAELGKGEGRQLLSKCNALSYHIFTVQDSAILVLQPEGPCERSLLSIFTVHITLIPCPVGFEQDNDRCTCDRRLVGYFNVRVCDINDYSIKKEGSMWLRYCEKFLSVHTNCPLDYCQVTSDTISLSSPDEQCANHRSGVICGACQDNHSVALGSSKCLPCTSNYTFIWLTLVFAVAGVALVALLLVLNMTISHGTLGGLIFYANVISTSGVTSIQNCSIHPVLSVFIAWLNLDLGVETCFYPGMDTYQKTWLQFTFPLYIWLLVVAIIVASYYSSRAMRVFGRNNVAILATLFRLSYSKILKTIITALSTTQLLRGNASDVTSPLMPYKVWTYDGNVEFLEGKHAILFAVALLLLLFLFLPYTLLLTFGQCVRSMSVRRRCVQRIVHSTAFISIIDAYHAPYSRKHRYWPGLILLTQCLLFICYAAIYSDNQIMVNMYLTTLVVSGVLTLKTYITNVYKLPYLNMLHICFLLNLLILSATLLFLIKGSYDSNICKTTSASISVAFITFLGILTYHAILRAKKTKFCVSVKQMLQDKLAIRKAAVKADDDILTMSLPNRKHPSSTAVELREELLASDEEK